MSTNPVATEGSSRKSNRKRCALIVTVISLVIAAISFGVLELVHDKNDDPDGPEYLENPMYLIYQQEPDFSQFTKDDSGIKYRDNFWRNPMYGGPITSPVVRPNP